MASVIEYLNSDILKDIQKIYTQITTDSEYELMFFKGKYGKNGTSDKQIFIRLLGYLKHLSIAKKYKLNSIQQLDVTYKYSSDTVYRISIMEKDTINKYIEMLHKRNNHVIFNVLASLSKTDKNIKIIKKTKQHVVDITDFDLRLRLSNETLQNDKIIEDLKIDETKMNNITFRYKQRVSVVLDSSSDLQLVIDLTNVKMNTNINKLESSLSNYELEIDLSTNKKINGDKYFNEIMSNALLLLKVIQQSNYVVSNSLELDVLEYYKNLLGANKSLTTLDARKPQSLEVQNVVDQLPDKYAVTDKADGERYFLIIFKKRAFLISDLLHVKDTGFDIQNEKYNGTVLDGEYIFIKNRHIYMAFDCLFNAGQDIRVISSLIERLSYADDVIMNCFDKSFKIERYDGKYDIANILKFHENQIKKFMKNLNEDLNKSDKKIIIRRKYFMDALGGTHNEIFKYSELMWKLYVYDKNINCPYILDGLIYHPLDQKYVVTLKDSKFIEYKWKPADKNSIDFYVDFEKDKTTGKVLTFYDNSYVASASISSELVVKAQELEIDNLSSGLDEAKIRDKPYKIANLYVGKVIKGQEEPVLFEPDRESTKYIAYIYLVNGEPRDIEGNIVQDETVVEFYYNNDPNIIDKARWTAMRTRYDKTESVQRFGRRYGNYIDIAYKVWRSIKNPITMDDFNILANDNSFLKHYDLLRNKIDHSVILSDRKENIYNQMKNFIGKPMRTFHNWMISTLIYTFISPTYENGRHDIVLELASGKGDQIMKYYYSQIDQLVGIESNNNNISSPVDGAMSRYNQLKKTHPNFPRMFFINANPGILLDINNQEKSSEIIMTPKNKELFLNFFPKNPDNHTQFDRIVCINAVHKFLSDDIVWQNFLSNVNMHLKPEGIMIIIDYDADKIIDLLKDKKQHTTYYTNKTGEQNVMFEIIKQYDSVENIIKPGVSVDIYNALEQQEGSYENHYLVQKNFLQQEFLDKCNMNLIDSDTFGNQFDIHKSFFIECVNFEDNEKTRKFLNDAAEYYTKSEVNTACFQMTRLTRYYVFQKKSLEIKQIKVNKALKKTQKAGTKEQIFNYKQFEFVRDNENSFEGYSFINSIANVLKYHELIPENLSVLELINDLGLQNVSDKDINKNTVNSIADNLIIGHDFSDSAVTPKIAVNGVNIYVIKSNCDGDKLFKMTNNKNTQSIILHYDGNRYCPLYLKSKSGSIGLYNKDQMSKIMK